ncbi:AAA family ATPase [Rhizohabitans arisaemae]|uniref:AAA family ATPase n=1 Tax=Rhizohabitans arisaemae TaxID=2720610 RepID=UPI0024B1D397|nr:AAA family ATPase [Rhizohabitans arisaemae]
MSSTPSISRVQVRGFRSIADCDVTLGPLTVIVGPNASGKSNFLDAIRFVVDALTDTPAQAITRRGGLAALLHHTPGAGTAESFEIKLTMNVPSAETSFFHLEIRAPHPDGDSFIVAREEVGIEGGPSFSRTMDLGVKLTRTDRLALPAIASLEMDAFPFGRILEQLTASWFYDLDPSVLREIDQDLRPTDVLGPRGEHLGQVLGALADEHPEAKETLDSALAALVENAVGIDRKLEGRYSTVQGRFITSGQRHFDPVITTFERESLSEGTLRAAGVLAALLQPRALSGEIPLIALEEPEKALYPSTLGGLYGTFVAAARRTQVIVTTQSSDLLDNESADLSHLVVVANTEGVSRIGPVGTEVRSLVDDKVMSVAELHRSGLMSPASESGDGR